MGRIVVLSAASMLTVFVAAPLARPHELAATALVLEGGQDKPAPANVTGAWDIVIGVPDAPLSLYGEWKQIDGAVEGSVFDAQEEMKVSGSMEGTTFKMNLYISGVVIRLAGEVKGDTITGKAGHATAGQVDWTATRAKAQ